MTRKALTDGAHHIGLTVPDLSATATFFTSVLGFELVAEKPDYPAVFVSDGTTLITLWQATDSEKAIAFDRKNVIGLHHFAFKAASPEALDELCERLRGCDDVAIEFEPEPLAGGPTRHMMFSIPGGIRMELISLEA